MLEVFLAKLFGLYLIIMGGLVLLRRQSMMPAVMDLVKNRALLLVLGLLDILAGLAVLLSFNEVSLSPRGLIALLGYVAVIEGLVYLALPTKAIQKMIRPFANRSWYLASGVIAVLAGIYLAGFGFGLF